MSFSIKTVDYKSKDAGKQFVESLRDTGFAVVNNHPLNFNLITSVYDEWSTFFVSDDKYSYLFNPETQDGYFPFRSENAKGYKEVTNPYNKRAINEYYFVLEEIYNNLEI